MRGPFLGALTKGKAPPGSPGGAHRSRRAKGHPWDLRGAHGSPRAPQVLRGGPMGPQGPPRGLRGGHGPPWDPNGTSPGAPLGAHPRGASRGTSRDRFNFSGRPSGTQGCPYAAVMPAVRLRSRPTYRIKLRLLRKQKQQRKAKLT